MPDQIFDTNAMLDWFIEITRANVPWLTQNVKVNGIPTDVINIFKDDPGEVYQGLKPYAIWLDPRNSIAHRESGNIGNIKGQPNIYTCMYCENVYESKVIKATEQERVRRTYNIIGGLLVNKVLIDQLCPPSEYFDIVAVSEEHSPTGEYINTSAGPMVGRLILVHVEERY